VPETGIRGAQNMPWGASLPEDVAKRVVNRTHNKAIQAQKEKEKGRSATRRMAKRAGGGYPHQTRLLKGGQGGGGFCSCGFCSSGLLTQMQNVIFG
jgi:hypothetical protein